LKQLNAQWNVLIAMNDAYNLVKVATGILCFLFAAFVAIQATSATKLYKVIAVTFFVVLARLAADGISYHLSLIETLEGKTTLTWAAYGLFVGGILGAVVRLFWR
jgi:hypothetical protein